MFLTVLLDIYYISFLKDHLVTKSIVYVLWLVETVQTVINISDMFDIFCYDFGNLSELDNVHLTWFNVPILSGFVGCVCQLFYAWQMYKFSKKMRWISLTLSMFAFIQFAGAIGCGITAQSHDRYSDLQTNLTIKVATMIWLGGSTLCDAAIALCMTYLVSELSQAHTGLKSTQVLISRLIRLTIETRTATATLAVIDITLFLAYPNNNYHTVPAICLVKVYSNTILAVCNSHMTMQIRGGREDATLHSYESFDLLHGGLNVELRETQTSTNAESSGGPKGGESKKTIMLLPKANGSTWDVLDTKVILSLKSGN
ncbi:uncharacterized protein EV420DRAFT_1268348 [Desarmillaria tabescens]|uniref:DUF6534 domain-containing protein n=1 Tax=Armillaria tabescens TaxID=1929756 RepID=A0AA39KFN0_ARMTA|nr:uncharacterized protein EV420DRAFT_1268348 [Desarmillaria tabescens]KAK0460152.1 hypothetical protein EV420DRAFT_1268348 [Desarmillaria tabescens]